MSIQTILHNMSRRYQILSAVVAAVFVVTLIITVLAFGSERDNSITSSLGITTGPNVVAVESSMLDEATRSALHIGDPAPDFSYTLADGSTHRLSDLRGQKVLLNFWATWCPPCTHEMPDIQAVFDQQRNAGFTVLAINRNEDAARVEAFADEMGLTIPLIANPAGDIADSYGVRGLPISYFINSDGTISFQKLGMMDKTFIEERLAEMH